MKLEIVTPDKHVFSGEVISVNVPGTEGAFGVLKDHAPIIATLKKGVIVVIDENKKELAFDIGGGVVEVLKNHIIVLAE